MRLGRLLVCVAALLLGAAPALSQPPAEEEIWRDLIHADAPLFSGGADRWPQPFYAEDSFGCFSRVPFGDWALREADAEPEDAATWYRIRNYGVFHCWAVLSQADDRDDLDRVESKPAFFVLLGTADDVELWALQIGVRPGSDYILLSRPAGETEIASFTVLQRECPRANVRDPGAIDILLTRYCSINSRRDLLTLARRMARPPPLGALSLVTPEAGEAPTD